MRSNLLSVVLFLCVGTLTAQINIGLRAGILGCSSVQSPAEEDAPPFQRIGALQAAIPIEISIGKSFAIQPEIMYGALGSKFEIVNKSEPGSIAGTTLEVTITGRNRTTVLELPVLAKLKFGSDRLRFFLQAGPSVAMGLNGKSTAKGIIRVVKDDQIINGFDLDETATAKFVKDDYAPSEVGSDEYAAPRFSTHLHFGGGFVLNLGRVGLLLDARYILGLSDLSVEADGVPTTQKYTDKSRRIGVGAGIMVPIR